MVAKLLALYLALYLKLSNLLDGKRLLKLVTSKYGALVSAIVLGIVASCGFEPINIWPLTILSLGLFMMLVTTCINKKRLFFVTTFYFAAFNTISLSWLNFVMEGFGQIPWLLSNLIVVLFSISYCALPYAIVTVLAKKLSNNRNGVFLCCFLPLGYILCDVFITWFLSGFPWNFFGYIAIEGPLKSYAPFVGARGISALIYIISASLALAALRKFLFLPIAALIFFIAILIDGVSFTTPQKDIDVLMVQGNIEQQVKRDPNQFYEIVGKYWALTEDHLDNNKLVIWPESAIPFFIQQDLGLINSINQVFKEKNATLVTGALTLDIKDDDYQNAKAYNSIITLGNVDNLDKIPTYNKRVLVPFGEIIPFADILKHVAKIFTIPTESFAYGEQNQEPIEALGIKFTPTICYETIFPETIKALDNESTQGILMVSNDSWFGPTKAPYQHLNIARMRSLELQKPMLRSTNSGVTAYINQKGEIIKTLPSDVEGVLELKFTPYVGQSFYSKHGNLILYILLFVLLVSGIYGRFKKIDETQEQINKLIRP